MCISKLVWCYFYKINTLRQLNSIDGRKILNNTQTANNTTQLTYTNIFSFIQKRDNNSYNLIRTPTERPATISRRTMAH